MADQGSIGIGRAIHERRLTDYQTHYSGILREGLYPGQLGLIIYVPEWSGLIRPGLDATLIRTLVVQVAFPNTWWNYPCVMDDRRGQLYWTAGSNGLFRIAEVTESPDSGDGWRWFHAGSQVLRCPVQAGLNTLTLRVRANRDPTPPPTVRLMANAALDITEQTATAPAGPNVIHPLTLNFYASQAGVVTLHLETLDVTENTIVDWLDLTISH